MVEVIVNDIDLIGEKYVVTLGNGAVFEFTNLKKAKAFNVKVSRFLTDKVHVLNELYKDIFSVSRQQWIIGENRGRKGKSHFMEYKKVNDSINDIAFWLDYIVSLRCHSAIYAFVVVKKTLTAIDELCVRIDKNFSAFPSYYNSYATGKIRYVARSIYKEVQAFGLDDCTSITESVRFEDLSKQMKILKSA